MREDSREMPRGVAKCRRRNHSFISRRAFVAFVRRARAFHGASTRGDGADIASRGGGVARVDVARERTRREARARRAAIRGDGDGDVDRRGRGGETHASRDGTRARRGRRGKVPIGAVLVDEETGEVVAEAANACERDGDRRRTPRCD